MTRENQALLGIKRKISQINLSSSIISREQWKIQEIELMENENMQALYEKAFRERQRRLTLAHENRASVQKRHS